MQHHATPIKKTKQDVFLEAFAIQGNISLACRTAQIERSTLYRWKEKSDTFLLRYNQAFEEAKDHIRAEIYRRAHDGVEEPVLAQGQLVYEYEPVLDENGVQKKDDKGKPMWKRGKMITVRKYSDTLLIFHAKMLMPEYRDKQHVEVSGPGGAPIQVQHLQQLTNEELDALERLVSQVRERATYGS